MSEELAAVALIAHEARDLAKQVEGEIGSHEKVCAERYSTINDKLGLLFKIISWAGGTAFLIVMGLLTFLAKTQFEQITALQKALDQQRNIPAAPPQVYIQPAPGSPTMGATVERKPATP